MSVDGEAVSASRREAPDHPMASARGALKIGVIGVGAVGCACLLSTVMRGCAREIVVVNRNRKRAKGVVSDMQYGTALSPTTSLYDGEYADLEGAALVMITAGVNEKAGGATDRNDPAGRLKLLDRNVRVYEEILPELFRAAPDAVALVVTDPPDPLADLVRRRGFNRVLSTGTYLDSLRFRFHLARQWNLDPRSVEAQVLGDHGTSEVFLWSSARVAGVPMLDVLQGAGGDRANLQQSIERAVRYANIAIIEGNLASQYGIGMVSARIAEIVLRDERAVVPIGSYNPRYGVTLSMPSVLGRAGVVQILEPEMSENERQALERSAETLRNANSRITPRPRTEQTM
jgi:L-lactate dehydrogenase